MYVSNGLHLKSQRRNSDADFFYCTTMIELFKPKQYLLFYGKYITFGYDQIRQNVSVDYSYEPGLHNKINLGALLLCINLTVIAVPRIVE